MDDVSTEYFKNLDEIEKKWRELKRGGFTQPDRDNFWRLCGTGQQLFWRFYNQIKTEGWMVKTVPAYERAVMLLEKEERYKDAIRLCEIANSLGINTDWYNKRIQKLKAKV